MSHNILKLVITIMPYTFPCHHSVIYIQYNCPKNTYLQLDHEIINSAKTDTIQQLFLSIYILQTYARTHTRPFAHTFMYTFICTQTEEMQVCQKS